MEAVAFTGEKRTANGKKGAKAVRNAGLIPGVLYGAKENINFSTTHRDIKSLIFTPDFKVAELTLDGTTYPCIIKDVQWHPVTDAIEHVDFLRLVDDQPIKVEVPVRFEGSSPGVRGGGKLQQSLRRVKIKCLPENLVDHLVLDISELELGHAIRIRDIVDIEGIEILNPASTPVASVEVPRALRSADAAAEEEGEEGEEEEGDDTAAE